MTISAKKIAMGAMVALSLGVASTTPAAAWCNGWGCGGGGWGGGGGMNPGAAAALGALGGVAVGAAIANSARPPAYYEAPPPAECWLERRPVYDSWGNYLGRRRVRVCE